MIGSCQWARNDAASAFIMATMALNDGSSGVMPEASLMANGPTPSAR